MKKILAVASVLCFLLVSVGSSAGSVSTDTKDASGGMVVGDRTFLSGTVINPVEENGTISAQALQVFYYNPGIFVDQVGVVKGLTTISFTKSNFIMVWTPGPFELVGYVLGFCKDFEIEDE
jgi:hypothetical protein